MARNNSDRIACEFFVWKVFQRDGVFYADGRANRPNLGKHSLNTRGRDDALAHLRELDRQKAIEMGLTSVRPEDARQKLPIADGFERYMKHAARPDVMGGVSPATRKRYHAVDDKFQPFCEEKGIRSWNEVDKSVVERYGAFLHEQGYADASIYLELTFLKQVVKWFVEVDKSLAESCRIHLPLRRSQDSDTYCPSREQVCAIIEFCQRDARLNWLAGVIVALCTTGVRIGELVQLRQSDVDLTTNIITIRDNRHSGRHCNQGAIRTTKGRRTRRIPIHPSLRSILEPLPKRPDGRVFGGARNGILKADTCRNVLIRDVIGPLKTQYPSAPGEIGFAHLRPHGFRHFFVSQSFVGGASEGEIRSWVGHRDSRIIERYRHLSNADAQRKMKAIDFLGEDDL